MTYQDQGNCLLSSVRRVFKQLGVFVAGHVFACMLLPVVVTVLSCIGFMRLTIYENMKHGYTPLNAPSRGELQIFHDFYARQGDPYILGLFGEAADGGSMLRPAQLNELLAFNDMVFHNLNVTPTSTTYTFDGLCGHYCDMNKPVYLFKEAYSGNQLMAAASDLSFPIATFFGIKTNLALNFYGVELYSEGSSNASASANASVPWHSANSDLAAVSMIALWYRADVVKADVATALKQWEMAVYDAMLKHNQHSQHIRLSPIGDHIVNAEVMRGGFETVPYFMIGALLLGSFVTASVLLSTRCQLTGRLQWHMMAVVVTAVASPIMASFTVIGGVLMFHGHINVMMMVIPILVLAVGVDDAFLLLHCWLSQPRQLAAPARLAAVYEDIGPSTSITSLTNSMAFAIGAIVPTPELRLFCVTTSLAMAADWVYEMSFFSASMVLVDRWRTDNVLYNNGNNHHMNGYAEKRPLTPPLLELGPVEKPEKPVHQQKIPYSSGRDRLIVKYSRFVMSWPARVLALVALAVYWTGAISGLYLMQPDMNPRVLVPTDSPLNRALDLHETHLWHDYNPTLLVVQQVPDLTADRHYDNLMQFIDRFESMPQSSGAAGTMFWLRDYEDWRQQMEGGGIMDSFFGAFQPDYDYQPDGPPETGRNFDDLPEFLDMPQYQHWTPSIHWHRNASSVAIDAFVLSVSYRNLSSLGEQAQLLSRLRDMAIQAPSPFDVTVYQLNAAFSDVILSVRSVTLRTLAVTLLSMAVVCAVFIGNVTGIAAAIVAVGSICTGVLGYLHWWGATLDPITMAFSLMAVGFSVDFTAHVCFHYYNCQADSVLGRLTVTLGVVAWPMLQAGISTALCMLSQAFTPLAAYRMLVKTIVLVVFLGFVHGLFFLPVLFAWAPQPKSGWRPVSTGGLPDVAGAPWSNANGVTESDPEEPQPRRLTDIVEES